MQVKEQLIRLRDMLIGPPAPPAPPVKLRDAAQMIKELQGLSELAWGSYAFSREPLKNKIPIQRRIELIEKANECGRQYADRIISRYGTHEPLALAKAMGLEVQYPERPTGVVRVTFAEYKPPKNIFLYTDAVDKARASMQEDGVAELFGESFRITDLLLAHELFHHVEEQYAKEIFTRTEKVELWTLKPFHNRSTIICLGEIAAMAFAKRLLALSFSPYVMDVFLIYGYNKEAACRLYEEMIEIAQNSNQIEGASD